MSDTEPPLLPPIAGAALSLVLLPGAQRCTEEIVSSWTQYLTSLKREYEILVTAEAQETLTTLAEKDEHIRILNPPTPGVGAALRLGVAAARHPLLAYAPADQQYPPAGLKRLLEHIDDSYLVSACRASKPVPPALRRLGWMYRMTLRVIFGVLPEPLPCWFGWGHQFGHILLRLLFGLRLHDAGSSFKLYRRELIERLTIQSVGSFAHIEILAKANFLGCLMDEAIVSWQPAGREESLGSLLADARKVLEKPDFNAPKPLAESAKVE